ncbi:YadA family autotransporter adhesin, partial [Nitratifractor sp.]
NTLLTITEGNNTFSVDLKDTQTDLGLANQEKLRYIDVNDTHVQIGQNSTAAATGTALGYEASATGAGSVATGVGAFASGDFSIAGGQDANASGSGAVALGYGAQAVEHASALGEGAKAQSEGAVAIGYGVEVTQNGIESLAVGSGSKVDALESVAVGNQSSVESGAGGAVAVGYGAVVRSGASEAVAFGHGATIESGASQSVAIGSGARVAANVRNSVALGYGSVATESDTVSVGSVGNERRITNVAPGINGTDAVNMDQLNAVSIRIDDNRRYIDEVDKRARAGTAMATAMSAMIPNPRDHSNTQISVGVGYYEGAAAMALGAFHYINDHLQINVGASISNHGYKAIRGGFTWGF